MKFAIKLGITAAARVHYFLLSITLRSRTVYTRDIFCKQIARFAPINFFNFGSDIYILIPLFVLYNSIY